MRDTIHIAPYMAVVFWLAFILIVIIRSEIRVMAAMIALNGALYWTARINLDVAAYLGLGPTMSLWGLGLFLHLGTSLVAIAMVSGAYDQRIYVWLTPVRRFVSAHTGHDHTAETGA